MFILKQKVLGTTQKLLSLRKILGLADEFLRFSAKD